MKPMDGFNEIADSIGAYVVEKYVKPLLSNQVSFYRAKVTAAASDGKITVQRPFDNPVALPYVGSAAGLTVDEQCVVLVFGGSNNAIIIGDGVLSNI